jgi:hypothetical protein
MENGVNPEWRLDKPQNLAAQAFAAGLVRAGFRDDAPGDGFHFTQELP